MGKTKKFGKKQHLKYMREQARKMREKKFAAAVNYETEIKTLEIEISTSTAQELPSSSLDYEDQHADCSKTLKVDPIQDLEIFDESNIEESEENIGKRTRRVKKEKNTEETKNNIEDTTEKILLAEEHDAGDIVKPVTNNSRKRKRTSNIKSEGTTSTRALRQNIAGIKIIYNDIDKFGEQMVFLLKRIPKKLCRELQDTIVTLISTAIENHKSKAKKNVTSSVSSSTPISQPELSRTLGNNPKVKKSKQLAIPEEALSIDSISDVIMGDHTPGETVQATRLLEVELGTTSDLYSRNQITNTFPKPMTLPIEFVGSMDCVKQEIFDPDESSNITAPEKYNEAQLGTSSDQLQFTSRNQVTHRFPTPMTLPLELVGSMDCVKQEILDSEESSNINAPEKYYEAAPAEQTLFNPFKTNVIKRPIEDNILMEKAKKFNIIPK